MDIGRALFIGGYLVLCLLVGLCGRYRRSGFLASALMALVLTPPVVLLLIYVFTPRNDMAPRQQ